jgi:hypothetical protein
MHTQYVETTGTDIAGSDIPCAGEKFCRVCTTFGSLPADEVLPKLKDLCDYRPGCAAIAYSPADGCGYLKSSKGPAKARKGWSVFAAS